MKSIIESITDALVQVRIIDEAFKRKQVVDSVINHSRQIARHVCKVGLYPQHTARKHWEKEIHSFVREVQELRLNGSKRLDKSEYHKLLHDGPFEGTGLISHMANVMVKDHGMYHHTWTFDYKNELGTKINNMYHDLSHQISHGTYEHIDQILHKHGI